MTTKFPETTRISLQILRFHSKIGRKFNKKRPTTPYRLREGGRTVGSGVVKEILE